MKRERTLAGNTQCLSLLPQGLDSGTLQPDITFSQHGHVEFLRGNPVPLIRAETPWPRDTGIRNDWTALSFQSPSKTLLQPRPFLSILLLLTFSPTTYQLRVIERLRRVTDRKQWSLNWLQMKPQNMRRLRGERGAVTYDESSALLFYSILFCVLWLFPSSSLFRVIERRRTISADRKQWLLNYLQMKPQNSYSFLFKK